MANYYTAISLELAHHQEFPFTEDVSNILYAVDEKDVKHAPQWFQDLYKAEREGDAFEDWCDKAFGSNMVCADYEMTDDGLWIHGDEGPNLEMIAAVIYFALRHYGIDSYVSMEYSLSCSKPRLDGFGGGAAFITKDGYEFFSTSGWLMEKEADFMKAHEIL